MQRAGLDLGTAAQYNDNTLRAGFFPDSFAETRSAGPSIGLSRGRKAPLRCYLHVAPGSIAPTRLCRFDHFGPAATVYGRGRDLGFCDAARGEGVDFLDDAVRREMIAFLPRLRRFAYGLTGSADAADDLLQAACERAIRHIDKWQPGTRLDSWMYRIARNLYLNEVRSRNVRGEIQDPRKPAVEGSFDGVRALESRLDYQKVCGLLGALPEEQRSVLLLVTVEGLSYREVADLLDLPIGTVTSRLARARIALTDFLESGTPGAESAEG